MELARHKYKKAWEWRSLLEEKKISAAEIHQEYLARVKADVTNSFLNVCEANSSQSAQTDKTSFFHNIPIALKDIFVTKGVPTTCASKILENYIPPFSATVVKKLENAGALSLGKLNMDEFAMGSSNENSAYGAVKNPYDHSRVSGGSSGASAAAVAANLVVASLGTDTGGSVRQPASFCGVTALKPTYGRVSRYGVIAFASSLDQVGPMTLDVQDCADLLQLIAGFDPKDSTSVNRDVEDYHTAVEKLRLDAQAAKNFVSGKTIGFPKEFFQEGLNVEIGAAVEEAIQAWQKAGANIVEIDLPHAKYALAVYYVVAVSEASTNLSRYDGVRYGPRVLKQAEHSSLEELYSDTRGELFGAEVKRRILLGTFALSSGYYDAYYKRACQVRNLIVQDFQNAFTKCDFIFGPSTPTTAFSIGQKQSNPVTTYLNDIYTVPVNLAGLPAMNIPWGFDKQKLPIGLQLIGKAFSEKSLLQAAAVSEIMFDQGGL